MTVPQAPVIATTITMSAQMFLKNPKNILLARAKAAIFYTTKEKKKKKVEIVLLWNCPTSTV